MSPHTSDGNRDAVIVFRGRAGDHNDLAMAGAEAIGHHLAARLNVTATLVGKPEPALDVNWAAELAAATPTLHAMADAYETVFANNQVPVSAISRCATALATLPVVARHRPDACIVWFDAHADLNTPANTTTGYLGGLALSGPTGLWNTGFGAGLALANVVLCGVRDLDPVEQHLIDDRFVAAAHIGDNLLTDLRSAVAGRPIYVHIDCDVLEPGIVPTDYVVPGGLSLTDLHHISVTLAENEVIGLEIAEFQATWTPGGQAVSPGPLLDALHPLMTPHHPRTIQRDGNRTDWLPPSS